MKYNELNVGTNTPKKRKGRGISAGQGKTAGRGTKGQNARSGNKGRRSFEGGQNPLMGRIPKLPGFKSFAKKTYTLTTDKIESIKEKQIDNALLAKLGVINRIDTPVKVVLKGELKSKKDLQLQGISANAAEAVKKAGGSFTKVKAPSRTTKLDS